MVIKAAIYARVSTAGQDTENQISQLREVAKAKGWEIVDAYVDHGISGSKGRSGRPQFDRLLKDVAANRKKFNVIMCWAVDRLGRSLTDLVGFLADVNANSIDLYVHNQQIDTTTAAGRAMFQMIGVFAEFERSIIVSRINAGLSRAREKGVKLGRKELPAVKVVLVTSELNKEDRLSYAKISRKTGVSVGKVCEIAKGLK